MSDPVIRVRGVGKRYRLGSRGYQTLREALVSVVRTPFERGRRGRVPGEPPILWALDDVSFDVARGEVVGVIGRNGAGKSTLLKILARITPPTTGRVDIRGRVGALLEVGTGFSHELTGRENVFLNGVILGMGRAEVARKLDDIVEFSGVRPFLDTPVKHYSSGMRVRLAFAVAVHLQPEILLLDEVLAVGDIEFQRKCIGRMERLARDGRTVILVSHHLATVRALCHRAVLLEAGRVARIGPAADVVEEYLGAYAVATADQTIDTADHVDGVRDLRLLRVILLNGVAGRFLVPWQEPIRLRLHFEALRVLDDVSFGAGIRTLDGVSLFTVHHDDGGSERWRLPPGEYAVDLEIHNILRPGLYRLHVGADLGRMAVRNILYVETVHLEVLGYAADQRVPATSNAGYVNGRSVWQRPQPVGLGVPSA